MRADSYTLNIHCDVPFLQRRSQIIRSQGSKHPADLSRLHLLAIISATHLQSVNPVPGRYVAPYACQYQRPRHRRCGRSTAFPSTALRWPFSCSRPWRLSAAVTGCCLAA